MHLHTAQDRTGPSPRSLPLIAVTGRSRTWTPLTQNFLAFLLPGGAKGGPGVQGRGPQSTRFPLTKGRAFLKFWPRIPDHLLGSAVPRHPCVAPTALLALLTTVTGAPLTGNYMHACWAPP